MNVAAILGEDATDRRRKFFRVVFGDRRGYLSIARRDHESNKFIEQFFDYPRQLNSALDLIDRYIQTCHLWFCPQLFNRAGRRKEHVLEVPCLWADLDDCQPERLLVKPSILLESSPRRHQALWLLDEILDPFEAEELSRRIAYRHRDDGADITGWDLTQLLRIPFTYNFKYQFPYPVVKVVDSKPGRHRQEDFKQYPLLIDQPLTNGSVLPKTGLTGADVLSRYKSRLSDLVYRLFSTEPDPIEFPAGQGWSKALWKLEVLCLEAGISPAETLAVARDAACNKYERDGKPLEGLWKEVQKAHAYVVSQSEAKKLRVQRLSVLSPMETPPEPGLVERYMQWACGQTDAAEVYHQASIFMILSAALSGMITLPTSFNPQGMKLNLWFMILGDTTLTRKSTAMDMGTDVLYDISQDAVVATDATIEGLLTTLATRPNKPSIFHRDEFAGLLESMQKKDYYAGMSEMMTKLYDGRNVDRQLARASIRIRDPIFIMFTGGIRSRILELMHEDYIRSGFLPRFLFFSAVSDVSKLKPLGPPTAQSDTGRAAIISELRSVVDKYDVETVMQIGNATIQAKREWKARLTPDAWKQYGEVEQRLLNDGINSKDPELFTPVYQRFGISLLKAATLLAAVRPGNPVNDDTVEVTPEDLTRALYYGEFWRAAALEVVSSAGTTALESKIRRIYGYIAARAEHGASRALMMRQFKMTLREADGLFGTLEARDLVQRKRQGSDMVYFPSEG